MKKWQLIEGKITADLAIKVFGKDKKDLFQNLLIAFSSLTGEIDKIKEDHKTLIIIKGDSLEEKIFEFIEKLIYFKDAKSLLFKKGEFKIGDKKIIAYLSGQKITPDLPVKIDIKALTRYQFKVKKNKYYQVTMVFDV